MPLTPLDRDLVQRCLRHDAGAWNDFVDRFLGLVYHVIHHAAHLRSTPLTPETVEDVAQEVLLQFVAGDYAFAAAVPGEQLAGVVPDGDRPAGVHARAGQADAGQAAAAGRVPAGRRGGLARGAAGSAEVRSGLENLEEVQALLRRLPAKEREVVRLFYLEGRSYEEISTALNVPVNSIGPVLTRAMRRLKPADAPAPARPKRARKAEPPVEE